MKVSDLNPSPSDLPLEAVVIAGGRGTRLMPHTGDVPKPMLPLAGRPIVEHILERLGKYGIRQIHLSVGYKGQQFVDYFKTGEQLGIKLNYIQEEKPLGTFGAISIVEKFDAEVILIMNADLLTNIDFGDMMRAFEQEQADMMVASVPYEVPVPYAILETEGNRIADFNEKPTYTYNANAGIYLIKKDLLARVPKHTPFHATDLMRDLIEAKLNVCSYPITGYWLDIGTPEDYEKAKQDIERIQF